MNKQLPYLVGNVVEVRRWALLPHTLVWSSRRPTHRFVSVRARRYSFHFPFSRTEKEL